MGIFKKYEDHRPEITGDEREKKGILLYFELIKRKFWNYVELNLLYFTTSLLSMAVYWAVLAGVIIPVIISTISRESWKVWSDMNGGMPIDKLQGSIIFYVATIGSVLLVMLFGGGVCSAGYHYVLRNYTRQENAFIFSDYFEQTGKNFFQALIVSIIDTLLVCVCLFSIAAYYTMMKKDGSMVNILAFAVMLFVFFIYAVMHTYIWTMMITFKISIWKIYKNALLLTFGAALNSIGYIVCASLFCALMIMFFAYMWIAAMGVLLFIGISAFNLLGHIFSYPVIKKYMIDNNNEN
ncbi:MAG: hypothetical protein Q8873_06260 [Bacillota bacterium]|nr:hypothetical protein [Bacillota bacterium]